MRFLYRLGADIVYASFNKLIINTNKATVTDAQSYLNFITDNIRARDLFHILDFKPTKFWSILLFMDSCNFGGISALIDRASNENDRIGVANNVAGRTSLDEGKPTEKDAESSVDNNDTEALSSALDTTEGEDIEIDANWNIMYYLPYYGDLQEQFTVVMANYLILVLKKIQELRSESSLATETVIVESSDGKEVMSNFDSILRDYCRALISSDITQKIVGVVHTLQMKRNKVDYRESQADDSFPILPGSYLKFSNPELEFVKSICHILSLDESVISEVEQMKKTVLRIINIGEFADCADFENPSLSFILREVICKECNYCRDIDLCRDLTLDFQAETLGPWKCTECSTAYDLAEIELTLVDELEKMCLSFVLQDLTCIKCKNVKQLNMKRTCECSGTFKYMMSRDKFRLQLLTLLNIANYYKMDYLKEMVIWRSATKRS